MGNSIFSKIIRGEVPSYGVYGDGKVFAFLDIHPETAGHVLVVPKVEVDKVYDLDRADWDDLWRVVRKVARRMEAVLGRRILIKVIGTDVAHAHVHLVPYDEEWRAGRVVAMSEGQMRAMAEKLKM
jgi:histidine triad (HIT) family protein